MPRPSKRRAGYRLPSGAVRVQVLLTPEEYRVLSVRAKQLGCSLSALTRTYLIEQLRHVPDSRFYEERLVANGKYQRRGFARA